MAEFCASPADASKPPCRRCKRYDSGVRTHPEWVQCVPWWLRLRLFQDVVWDSAGELTPVIQTDVFGAHSRPRQFLPQVFLQNASIDVIRTRTILEKNRPQGRVGSLLMEEFHDIDTPRNLPRQATLPGARAFRRPDILRRHRWGNRDHYAEQRLQSREPVGGQYSSRINRLHASGNRILLFTARWWRNRLEWGDPEADAGMGCHHHDLRFGKPSGFHRRSYAQSFRLCRGSTSVDSKLQKQMKNNSHSLYSSWRTTTKVTCNMGVG